MFNFIFVHIPVTYILSKILISLGCSYDHQIPELKTVNYKINNFKIIILFIFQILIQLVGLFVTHEIWYYYSHRILHSKLFYKYHKTHHEWQTPIASIVFYTHPVEHVFLSIMSGYFGEFICYFCIFYL
jgi:sterol desaturase/sphingolipid hydroxylase (fatty acid hydroxylase superfamily)